MNQFELEINAKVKFGEYGGIEFILETEYPSYGDVYQKIVFPNSKTLLYVPIGSYSGDFYILSEDQNNEYLFYKGTFGSCSGCDELQAVQNKEDLIQVCERMYRGSHRFDKYDMKLFLETYVSTGLRDTYNEQEAKEESDNVRYIRCMAEENAYRMVKKFISLY